MVTTARIVSYEKVQRTGCESLLSVGSRKLVTDPALSNRQIARPTTQTLPKQEVRGKM